jgi:hypothetical protein
MAKIIYQDDLQTLFEISELVGGGKKYEIIIKEPPEPDSESKELIIAEIIKIYASKKSSFPKMPIKSWDTIIWPCCNLQYSWMMDTDNQFWVKRFEEDKWDKTEVDYILWLMADIFKDSRNIVRGLAGLELEK